MVNRKIAGPWLVEFLSGWISKKTMTQDELRNMENIMYNTTRNKGFCFARETVELSVQWFLSPHSFNAVNLHPRCQFLQRWWYFKKYSFLLMEGMIDIAANEDKVKKFLTWIDGWVPLNKQQIERNVQQLMDSQPGFIPLWRTLRMT